MSNLKYFLKRQRHHFPIRRYGFRKRKRRERELLVKVIRIVSRRLRLIVKTASLREYQLRIQEAKRETQNTAAIEREHKND